MMAGKTAKPVITTDTGLDAVLAGIDKDFGPGTLMRLGDATLERPEVFSSGSIALDEALGIGGIARGRIVEIYGPESSGKTSLALHATGNAQRQGLRAAFIDAEHAFDPEWADTLGVDTENLYVSQPDSGEQALKVAARLVASGKFGVITVDSVAALVPEAELKGEIGDSHVGLQARMMSQGLRMLAGPCAATGTTVMFINQLREKVGVFFGSSETQPGGKALKFYASLRLDVRRIQTIKAGERPIGSKVRVKVVKNKLARPFGVAEFDFLFGEGISRNGELLDLGVDRKVVKKSGAFYTWSSHSLGQGKEAARKYLAEHPDVAADIDRQVREATPAAPAPRTRAAAGDGEGITMDGPAPWDGEGEEDDSSSDT
jgi:recombination protein RecA